ncbi:phage replication protein [Geopseudomonas aromaticivorans]|uniref:phage replication protein n=1 Tax=Geopseudomonas aromaticivorans TaxID=2849492 RepID=UPI0020C8D0B8|nr:phage replication protein [Pseudomonas aromaticivorans]
MQFTITMNQVKALEWGLNAQQALLFAFVYECPSWAKPIKAEAGIFYALSKAKIIEELPLLTDKPDTAYRLLRQLEVAGVIELSHTAGITLVRLTDKGREWNRKIDGSEKYPKFGGATSEKNPSRVGKKSEVGRKNIREGSEKSPTNQDTSQETNQETSQEEQGACAPRAAKAVKFDPLTARPANVSPETWADWCQHRREIRKPLTAASCRHQSKQLESHPTPDHVLHLSIANGWTGLFPEKSHASSQQPRAAGRPSAVEQVREAIAARAAAEAAPGPAGQPVAEDDGDVRAPLDGEFRRVG